MNFLKESGHRVKQVQNCATGLDVWCIHGTFDCLVFKVFPGSFTICTFALFGNLVSQKAPGVSIYCIEGNFEH